MKAKQTPITAEYVRSILDYDPETGVFVWKERPCEHFVDRRATKIWNTRYARQRAGTLATNNYGYTRRIIRIDGTTYTANRVAYLMMTGEWPVDTVDHRNLDGTDDKWCNLRLANMKQQQSNKKGRGKFLKGVQFERRGNKFVAKISIDNRSVYLGTFGCPAAASFAYQIAADKQFGEFARPF